MSFAKMQTPQTLRDSFLLTDADFETIREGEEVSVGLEPDTEEVSSDAAQCCALSVLDRNILTLIALTLYTSPHFTPPHRMTPQTLIVSDLAVTLLFSGATAMTTASY